jgi:hypothetical protein
MFQLIYNNEFISGAHIVTDWNGVVRGRMEGSTGLSYETEV